MNQNEVVNEKTLVSVVIPTILRDSVVRSIRSARAQASEKIQVEVIVVCDLEEGRALPPEVTANADRVIFTGGGRRATVARNMGVQVSKGEFIAFLDDDDEWHQNKSRLQIEALQATGQPKKFVASCRVTQPWTSSGSSLIPKKTIRHDETVEDYLFRNRGPSIQRASIFTSSLLCHAEIARACLWDAALPRHQDWDWLIRLQKDMGVDVLQLSEALLTIYPDSPDSISAKSDWESSLRWAASQQPVWDRKTYADFLAAQTLRYALQARSVSGLRLVLRALAGAGQFPSLPTLATAAAGVLPKAQAMRLLSSVGQLSTSRSGR